jgi:hypothetical protein
VASLYFAFAFRKGSGEGGAPTPPPPPTTTTTTMTAAAAAAAAASAKARGSETEVAAEEEDGEGGSQVPVEPLTHSRRANYTSDDGGCRVGVYFGSFDPIHENHVAVAQHAQHAHGMRFVYLVSNADNPRKPFVSALRARAELIDVRLAQPDL